MTLQALASILTDPRHQTYVKLVILGFLVAASLLPLRAIRDLVLERQQTSLAAEEDIVASWGGGQRIVGPVLVVPLASGSSGRDVTSSDTQTGITYAEDGKKFYAENLFIMPESLSIDTELDPQIRRRGIYETVLYTAVTSVSGRFARPNLEELGIEDAGRIQWNKARFEVFIADIRGIIEASDLDWNGTAMQFRIGPSVEGKIVVSLPTLDPTQASWPAGFSFNLDLKGSRTFGFAPIGDQTMVTVRSPWPHPSFFGGFPPLEMAVAADGFSARWSLSRFDREMPRAWLGDDSAAHRLSLRAEAIGALVRLVDPVDHYLKSERSVKYGILFVILVSCVLFLFEVVSGARVHPIQYGMVAAALCLFFLLLVSLSEAIGFGAGYLLAASLTIALLSTYIAAIFRSRRRGAALAGLLALVYGYMYLTLRSEDHALLLGSLLLFGVLAGAMIVTRNFDWYAVGRRLSAVPNPAGDPPTPTNRDSSA